MTESLLATILLGFWKRGETIGPWEWFNPDSWMDVTDHLLLVIGAWGLVAIPVLLTVILGNRKQLKSANDKLEQVQVGVEGVAAGVQETNKSVNCRPTTMRKDFDEMRAEMRAGFRQVTRDIGGLREELRTERVERIEGDKRR